MIKFTQNEVFEIQKQITLAQISITLCRGEEDRLHLFYQNDKSVKATVRRTNYTIVATNSNGPGALEKCTSFLHFLQRLNIWMKKIKEDNPFDLRESNHIIEISPRFYKVFKEAIIIYHLGFEESAGMIFRKALEILIKDYFCSQIPEHKGIIVDEMLSQTVDFFFIKKDGESYVPRQKTKFRKKNYDFTIINVELQNLQSLVKIITITFKIGNDFSHYERELEKYTPSDMKRNIEQIMEFIDNEFELKEGRQKQKTLNKGFEEQKLLSRKKK